MTPEKTLRTLFIEALGREEAGERKSFLEEACGGDSVLRERLEDLLRANDDAGGFLSHPSQKPPRMEGLGTEVVRPTEKPGDHIGRYKLLQQIGEGGCGVVYMAEQEEPVRRRLALKIIKLGMDTKQVVARFEAERQALALMDHPNIAKVLDGGATESGRPYFVMELVRGTKITEFCDEQKLPTRARLELFIQVCSAIQHAHQKGIIHRDLKPSNLLVTMVDGAPIPKVIDFGIAKATNNQRLTDKTVFTAFEQFIGTPAYMSPEQAEMSGVDVDTRTDLYSLGVVLYELLSGKPPFETVELQRSGLDAMRRTIREREPAKPSKCLGNLAGMEATTVAAARKTDLPILLRVLQGDLDWIVMKCLEKDRNRRYESAHDLAADLKRYLGNEPVVARPPSNFYRFQKLVGRHRTVSASAAILLLLLVAGGFTLWRSDRELRRSLKAEQKSRNAENEALYSSLIGQARAQRQSGRMGQRFETLKTIQRAAQIRPTLELRNQLAATLALPDLQLEHKWPIWFKRSLSMIGFAPDLASYIEGNTNGGFMLRSAQDRSVLRNFSSTNASSILRAKFSPDNRRVAVEYVDGSLEIWPLSDGHPWLSLGGSATNPAVADFHPDGETLAAQVPGEGLCLFSMANGSRQLLLRSKEPALTMRFDAQGERLAIVRPQSVESWSCKSNSLVWKIPVANAVPWLAWSPVGRWLLASSDQTQEMLVLGSGDGKTFSRFSLQGYKAGLFEFHPDGLTFASESWDRTLRFWDLMTGEELLRCPASVRALRFSADGGHLAASPGNFEVGLYEVATTEVFRELRPLSASKTSPSGFSRNRTGRFLLSTAGDRLVVWDTQAGAEIHSVTVAGEERSTTFFGPGDTEIYSSRWNAGIHRRTFAAQEDANTGLTQITLGPERAAATRPNNFLWDVARTEGSWLVKSSQGKAYVWPAGTPDQNSAPVVSDRGWLIMRISPDARWVLTTVYPGADLNLWNVAGRTNAHIFHGHSVGDAWFSPDGNWVVAGTPREYRTWKVGTWEPGPVWPADLGGLVAGHVAFAKGGRFIALEDAQGSFRLMTFPEGRELARLEPPKLLGVFGVLMNEEATRVWILGFGNRVYEWNLTALRKELAGLGLDWQD